VATWINFSDLLFGHMDNFFGSIVGHVDTFFGNTVGHVDKMFIAEELDWCRFPAIS